MRTLRRGWRAYSTALAAGWMSVNDVRAFEDLRPVDEGGQYRVPLQNIPLTDAPVITISGEGAGGSGADVGRVHGAVGCGAA